MRFSTIAAFATSLAVVSAQTDLSSVPDCAITCLAAAVSASGCSTSDTKCQCTTGQAAIISSLQSCVPSHCDTDDANKVTPALISICSAAGITVTAPAAASATSAASGASSASKAVSSALSAASTASSRAASATGSASHSASATTSGPAQSTGGATANAAGLSAVLLGVFVAAF